MEIIIIATFHQEAILAQKEKRTEKHRFCLMMVSLWRYLEGRKNSKCELFRWIIGKKIGNQSDKI